MSKNNVNSNFVKIAVADANGNISGITVPGNITANSIQVNGSNGSMTYNTSNSQLIIRQNNNPSVFDASDVNLLIINPKGDTAGEFSMAEAVSRGSVGNIQPLQLFDSGGGLATYFYTGNGNITVDGVSGYSGGTGFATFYTATPTGPNRYPSSAYVFAVSNAVTNTQKYMIFDEDATLSVYNNIGGGSPDGNIKTGNLLLSGGTSKISGTFSGTLNGIGVSNTVAVVNYGANPVDTTFNSCSARGTGSGNIQPLQVGDALFRLDSTAYSGNGLTTIDGVTGWQNFSTTAGAFTWRHYVTALPTANNTNYGTQIDMITSNAALNNEYIFSFTDTGGLVVPGNITGGNLSLSGNINPGNTFYNGVQRIVSPGGAVTRSMDLIDYRANNVTDIDFWSFDARGVAGNLQPLQAGDNTGIFFQSFYTGNGAAVDPLGVSGYATPNPLIGWTNYSPPLVSGGIPTYDVVIQAYNTSNAYTGLSVGADGTVSGPLRTTTTTPASATAPGVAGQIAYDANFVYICVATNTWKRSPLTTW